MTARARAFGFVAGLAIAVWLALSVANAPLRTPAAPYGIISFELAGTTQRAADIIASWGPRQREAAAFGLGLDFLFLLLYPMALSLAAGLVAERLKPGRPRAAQWGKVIALVVPLAAILDAIENAALWRMLQLGPTGNWPALAVVMATLKFGLVFLAAVYIAGGWLVGLRRANAG